MIKESVFDEVHDCQGSFRCLLHAISNPGEIVDFQEYACKFEGDHCIMLMLALTLLDKETSHWVVDNKAFSRTLTELTYSRPTEEKAGFIFITRTCSEAVIDSVFAEATPGSLVEPHTNSILMIAVDDFEQNGTCTLKGPGIKELKAAGLSTYARMWISKRDRMEYEYPEGVDIFFVSAKGALMAIPRKVKMEG
jgi:alpha-D-ribose 1-methylphosphonate 5-triphosphate synthase subunit PhnH